MQKICTCLWFNDQAEEAAAFYVSLFPNSRILNTSRYKEGSPGRAGSVMTVQFVLDAAEFVALNGGPIFKFSPAISIVANCDSQEEIDRLWSALTREGQAGQCGWLTDKYGVSWQIVPRALSELLNSADAAASQRAFSAMLKMAKIDLAAIRKSYAGS